MEHPEKSPVAPGRKTANRRLGLILLTIAAAFFLGFFVKMLLLR